MRLAGALVAIVGLGGASRSIRRGYDPPVEPIGFLDHDAPLPVGSEARHVLGVGACDDVISIEGLGPVASFEPSAEPTVFCG